MNTKIRINYFIFIILVIFIIGLISCRSCRHSSDIKEIYKLIPYNASFFISFNDIYHFQKELFNDGSNFETIIEHTISQILEGNLSDRNLGSELFSILDESLLNQILTDQIAIGFTEKQNSHPVPFFVLSYNKESSRIYKNAFDKIIKVLEKHSNQNTQILHSNAKVFAFSLEFQNKDQIIDISSDSNNIDLFFANSNNCILASFSRETIFELIDLSEDTSPSSMIKNPVFQYYLNKDIIYNNTPLIIFENNSFRERNHSMNNVFFEDDSEIEGILTSFSSIFHSSLINVSRETDELNLKGYIRLNTHHEDQELLNLLRTKPIGFDFLNITPRESLVIIGLNILDLTSLYEYIETKTRSSNDQKSKINFFFEDLNPNIGISLKDDLMQNIGQEIGIALFDSFFGSEIALYIRHKNYEEIKNILEKLKKSINDSNNYKNYEEHYEGYNFTVYPLGVFSPSLLITGDYVIIGSTRVVIKKIIDTINDNTINIFNDPVFFKQITENKIDQKLHFFHITRNKKLLNTINPILKTAMNIKGHENMAKPGHKSLIESILDYINIFESSSFTSIMDEEGYLLKTNYRKSSE